MGRFVMTVDSARGPATNHAGRANAGNGIHAGYRGTVARMFPGSIPGPCNSAMAVVGLFPTIISLGMLPLNSHPWPISFCNSKESGNVDCCGSSRKSG